jgi:hypothetical protein
MLLIGTTTPAGAGLVQNVAHTVISFARWASASPRR